MGGTEAELADSMTAAFRTVCRSVGVTKTGHYATDLVATKIVELAKDGVETPTSYPAVFLETSTF
jgi:hypothetical protein